jgi:hypothetical protein
MDQEYVTKYQQKSQKQPEHIGQGLVTGVKSVGKGLLSGVTGLVVDPYKGMKQGVCYLQPSHPSFLLLFDR